MSKLTIYMFSYHYHGDKYAVDIPAYTLEEAEGRIANICYATYEGEEHMRIPAFVPSSGIFARLNVWFRNTFFN